MRAADPHFQQAEVALTGNPLLDRILSLLIRQDMFGGMVPGFATIRDPQYGFLKEMATRGGKYPRISPENAAALELGATPGNPNQLVQYLTSRASNTISPGQITPSKPLMPQDVAYRILGRSSPEAIISSDRFFPNPQQLPQLEEKMRLWEIFKDLGWNRSLQ